MTTERKRSSLTNANVPPSGSSQAKWSGWRETEPLRYFFMPRQTDRQTDTHTHKMLIKMIWVGGNKAPEVLLYAPPPTHIHTHTHTHKHIK